MYTGEHELKDLLEIGSIDKIKLYDGILKGDMPCKFVEYSYQSNKDGINEYKKDVFLVYLEVNDYLLKDYENVNLETQLKYSTILQFFINGKCHKLFNELFNELSNNVSISKEYAIAYAFPVNRRNGLREMGVVDE
jgi:hypothetical protein